MTNAELETYLHTHIPLSRAMAVSVVSSSPNGVILAAPLAANINHHDTVFGGSAAAIATLAAWSMLHLRLQAANLPNNLVIQSSSMDYLSPIAGDFTATANPPTDDDWAIFLRIFERRGRARIQASADLIFQGKVAARFSGAFVAVAKES